MAKVPQTRPLALTSGEPAGIGPDIALAAWLRRHELDLPPFYLLGDRAFFAERAKILGLTIDLADATPEEAGAAFAIELEQLRRVSLASLQVLPGHRHAGKSSSGPERQTGRSRT